MHEFTSLVQRHGQPWPVVVAGSGGSGTRLLVQILRSAGIYMGTNVNDTEDAISFRPFNRNWVRPYLKHRRGTLSSLDHEEARRCLEECVAAHTAQLPYPSHPWGWKRPEFIFVLPWLKRLLPNISFLHVVRNGLDMAFSSNQNDLKRFSPALFGGRYDHEPEALRSLRVWVEGNLPAVDFGESSMGPRYLRLHYEALCAHPAETIATVFHWLGLSADPAAAVRFVSSSPTIGRWRSVSDPKLLVRLMQAGKPALVHFDYWDESIYLQARARVGVTRLALLPVDDLAGRTRHWLACLKPWLLVRDFTLRFYRAVKERRLRAAFRKRWVRWTSPWLRRGEGPL